MKPDLTGAQWHKSTRSNGSGNCVEVATNLTDIVAVRDTKDNGSGPVLLFTPAEWDAFVGGAKAGEFDL
ncbi:DUF397 domain-containing protein [Actinoplanes sp. NPDC049668]|uniref:DUF397 domain-containing protein n=1 Tax=unclassified Actinoplanes TaxID=2626549 RepID=UPI0033A00DA7